MTWKTAYAVARTASRKYGRKYYVRGFRTSLGKWRYGAYRESRPENGRTWQQ